MQVSVTFKGTVLVEFDAEELDLLIEAGGYIDTDVRDRMEAVTNLAKMIGQIEDVVELHRKREGR